MIELCESAARRASAAPPVYMRSARNSGSESGCSRTTASRRSMVSQVGVRKADGGFGWRVLLPAERSTPGHSSISSWWVRTRKN